MKWFLFLGIFLLPLSETAFAETMYVGEVVNITLRTGMGTDHKIIEMIRSGQSVEVLETGADWSQIRLANGKEGWVLTRLLTYDTPKGVLLEKLRREHNLLLERVKEPLAEIKLLEVENTQLKEKLAETETRFNSLNRSFGDLKKRSDALSKLKDNYQRKSTQMGEIKNRAQILEKEVKRLQRQQMIRWFLAGAGVLFLGIIIGLSAKSKRRKSSLLS